MKKISLCIPCYNEEKNIPLVYRALTKIMEQMKNYDYEMIFEDNASTDRSIEILRDMAKEDSKVKVILNTRNFGPSRSGKNCCFNATGDVIISVAADLQNPVSMIPVFIKYWEEGYKVVMGQKNSSKEGKIKYALRKLYYKIISVFSEVPQISNITGFGAIDSEVYRKVYEMREYEMSIRHLLAELGYEIKLVSYEQEVRKHGKSSYNLWRSLDFSINSLIHTSYAPIRIITLFGLGGELTTVLGGMGYLIYKIVTKSYGRISIIPIIMMICLIGFIQIFFLGIIGEYISNILKKVTVREIVTEKERINFGDEPCVKDEKFTK